MATQLIRFVVPDSSLTPIFDEVVAELGMTWPDPRSWQ